MINLPVLYIIVFIFGIIFGFYLAICSYRYFIASVGIDERDQKKAYEAYKKLGYKYIFLWKMK